MLCKNVRLAALFVVASVCGTSAGSARRDSCQNGVDPRCCALNPMINTLQDDFFDGGQCNTNVRMSLRLAFHDAIGYSKTSSVGDGADGSIMIFKDTELKYPVNSKLDIIVQALEDLLSDYSANDTGVVLSPGDIIQLATAVGIANCPGAPRLPFFLGRSNATMAAPAKTICLSNETADQVLTRFDDAGFNPYEVVALLSAHSIAKASFTVGKAGAQYDCTPQLFDTQFFAELQGSAQCPIPDALKIRIPSDIALAQDNRTGPIWKSFIGNQTGMANAFRDAMAKLSVLGQNASNMIDCSAMIPEAKPLIPQNHPNDYQRRPHQR